MPRRGGASCWSGFEGLDRYLASIGGEREPRREGARAYARVRGAALRCCCEDVFAEQTDFELRPERLAGGSSVCRAVGAHEHQRGDDRRDAARADDRLCRACANKGPEDRTARRARGCPRGRALGRRRRRDGHLRGRAPAPRRARTPTTRSHAGARSSTICCARCGCSATDASASERWRGLASAAGAWTPLALGTGGSPHGHARGHARAGGRAARVLQPRLPPRARGQRARVGAATLRAGVRARRARSRRSATTCSRCERCSSPRARQAVCSPVGWRRCARRRSSARA